MTCLICKHPSSGASGVLWGRSVRHDWPSSLLMRAHIDCNQSPADHGQVFYTEGSLRVGRIMQAQSTLSLYRAHPMHHQARTVGVSWYCGMVCTSHSWSWVQLISSHSRRMVFLQQRCSIQSRANRHELLCQVGSRCRDKCKVL